MTVDGEARGLFTQIPWTDAYSGWICQYDSSITSNSTTLDETVVCLNHYMNTSNAVPAYIEIPNLIGHWNCTAEPVDTSDDTQIVECRNRLPDEDIEGIYEVGQYRW